MDRVFKEELIDLHWYDASLDVDNHFNQLF